MTLLDIIEWTLRTSIALVAIWIIFLICRKRLPASFQFSFWLWIGALIPVSLFFANAIPSWEVLPDRENAIEFLPPLLDTYFAESPEPQPVSSKTTTPMVDGSRKSAAIPWWIGLWLLGVFVFLGRLGGSYWYLLRRKTPLSENHIAYQRILELQKRFRIRIRRAIKLVELPGSPMTWGVFRPTISLPRESESIQNERLDMVLLHELSHIARRDPLWLLISQIILAVFWFHPGLWFVSRLLRVTHEQAADDLVLGQGVSRADYAELVLSFVGLSKTGRLTAALCGMAAEQRSRKIEKRIASILAYRKTRNLARNLLVGGILAGISTVAIMTSLAAEKLKKKETIVILDPGNGGSDYGSVGKFGSEKVYNLDMALKIEAILKESGIACLLTRRTDVALSDEERLQFIDDTPQSIFISIHHKAESDPTSIGPALHLKEGSVASHRLAQVLLYQTDGKGYYLPFVEDLKTIVLKKVGFELHGMDIKDVPFDRGIKIETKGFTQKITVPGFVLQCGEINNPKEAELIVMDSFRAKMAQYIASGITRYLEDPSPGKIDPTIKDPPIDAIPLAEGFDYPVGAPNAEGYYVFRGFKQNGHLGEDWNGEKGRNTDLGDPVHSIGKGVVKFAKDFKKGWGNVIIVRHKYRESPGKIKMIDSLYGHLERIDVKEGSVVDRGQIIGTIGRGPHNKYAAHLHFEIRRNLEIGMNRAVYSKTFANYYSPRYFIDNHR